MKLGLDIGSKVISIAAVNNDGILDFLDRPVASAKKNNSRATMDEILASIHSIAKCHIKGIGLSLPSRIDRNRGVMYDIRNIPYWKNMTIKRILEDEFNTKVWINNDVNCFILGEKYYGMCKDFKDIVYISLGSNAGVSVIVNNKLFFENNYRSHNHECLSVPYYSCVRLYKSHFTQTMEELSILLENRENETTDTSGFETWNELGVLVGRLISILLCNYEPEIIVLGGHWAKFYVHFSEPMDKYLEKSIHPRILSNMIIFVSSVDHQRALGATSMVRQCINLIEI